MTEYRESDAEQSRTNDLTRIIRKISGSTISSIDIGARDGFFSRLLAEYFDTVLALDLEKPSFSYDGVTCVQGDATDLKFDSGHFDLVFCAEVLEHIPTQLLDAACSELSRVSSQYILIGVPYKQDIRLNRNTCHSCGETSPPWGHVNSFDEKRLESLFPEYTIEEKSFVGKTKSYTNSLSAALMDFAGNPYGTYEQDEPCGHCGKQLIEPPERTLLQRVASKVAFQIRNVQGPFIKEHPNWIHVLFKRK
ncbi:MAG: class I SAM-dependent methyltransferase [Gammaproteobacteria bacterium]